MMIIMTWRSLSVVVLACNVIHIYDPNIAHLITCHETANLRERKRERETEKERKWSR